MATLETFEVEVVYLSEHEQFLTSVRVQPGATVRQVLERARITERFPALEPAALSVGLYGRTVSLETVVAAHDRVEIYRPLRCDPKEARRRRAERRRAAT